MKINYEPGILWPGLFISLCALHPIFIIPVFISVHKYKGPWAKQIDQQFSDYKWWYFGFLVFAFIIGYLKNSPFPQDDLLRHVVAYQFDYNYHNLYVYSSFLPKFNQWIGFEVIAGKLHQLLGPEYSVRVIQLLAVISLYGSFFGALNKILKGHPDKWLWFAVIFALCSPLMSRVFFARPEIFFTAWLLSATFLYPWVWLAVGILIMPTYWLGIIYAPGALLLNTTWRNRIIYAALFSLSSFAFWYFYSEGEFLRIPYFLSQWSSNRVADVAELGGILIILGSQYMAGLLMLTYYFLYRSSFKLFSLALPLCLLIAFFLLPNYVRYMLPIVALTGLLCAVHLPKDIKISPHWSLIVLIFSSLIVSKSVPSTQYQNLPKFKIPVNAVVLTQFDEGAYSAILHNPHAKFAPAMEFGATNKEVQALIADIHRKNLIDCERLKNFSFTHLQENSLKTVPPCLDLSQVDGKWRLWKIR